ncbi:sporulation histidine kinase inhibitor Sda [Heyndrickxia oleronia]|uniref:Sporulation histidine kinase inhibitor Sda n=1 Tax=Heyndrickxia oleronia TaxID=38875 RepID=A0AAW6SQ31_9BACI|nr:sporulation histidine kinase inhibitor Sda [Heyndrickxia oleronia]MDH5160318.1 sporulation histidine kinase inhibitor Sda [Heyndrickxia oleronia]
MRNLESLLKLSNQGLLEAYNTACKLKLSLEFINLLKEELIKRSIPF